jgi:hypothetical protein
LFKEEELSIQKDEERFDRDSAAVLEVDGIASADHVPLHDITSLDKEANAHV